MKLTGTVYKNGEERAGSAIVKATPKVGQTQLRLTDDDGDFEFSDLAVGEWTLVALDADYSPSRPESLNLPQGEDKLGVRLDVRRRMGTHDAQLGNGLFWSLIGALTILVVAYVVLHLAYPTVEEPLGASLVTMVDQAAEQAGRGARPSQDPGLVSQVAQLKTGLGAVLAQKPQGLSASDAQVLADLAQRIELAVREDRQDDAVSGLRTLRTLLTAPQPGAFLWSRAPGRYLEALFWGAAGVLVYLIITVATYLRWGRFYAEGFSLHVAQIVTVPLISLVAVLLLSLATLSISLGGNQLSLDLKDPQVLSVVAFLLALQPWDSLRFLRTAAGRITGDEKQGKTSPAVPAG